MKTYSAVKALEVANEVATRTLSAALIYQNDECYTVEQCPIEKAKRVAAMCGTAVSDDGHVVGVIFH